MKIAIEKIIELDLTTEEKKMFDHSVNAVEELVKAVAPHIKASQILH